MRTPFPQQTHPFIAWTWSAIFGSSLWADWLTQRLCAECEYRSREAEWLDAWNIPLPRPLGGAGRLKGLTREQAAGLLGISLVLAFDLALWETFGRILAEHF